MDCFLQPSFGSVSKLILKMSVSSLVRPSSCPSETFKGKMLIAATIQDKCIPMIEYLFYNHFGRPSVLK